jgi:hypothetical protein
VQVLIDVEDRISVRSSFYNAHCRGISFIDASIRGRKEGTIINQPVFAHVGVPTGTIVLNETNVTTGMAPIISEDTTITPAPEVNDTLIGRSTPTTSNTLQTDEGNNKTGETEPIGRVKWARTIARTIVGRYSVIYNSATNILQCQLQIMVNLIVESYKDSTVNSILDDIARKYKIDTSKELLSEDIHVQEVKFKYRTYGECIRILYKNVGYMQEA